MKLLVFLLVATVSASTTAMRPVDLTPAQAISALWKKTDPTTRFVRTSVSQARFMEEAVPKLWRGLSPEGPDATELVKGAQDVRLSLVLWRINDEHYWLLGDSQDSLTGAGRYLFRVRPRSTANRLLQAPHAFFDRHTGAIAAQLFFSKEGSGFRAFFANSIQRYQASAGGPRTSGASASDVCHNPEHLFSTATLAARRSGASLVLQLHGFGEKTLPNDVSAVVSAGRSRSTTADSVRVAGGLRALLGPNVKLFPNEIQALGATQNVQGRLVRDPQGNGFVHVELSLKIRESLLNNDSLRKKLASMLAEGGGKP